MMKIRGNLCAAGGVWVNSLMLTEKPRKQLLVYAPNVAGALLQSLGFVLKRTKNRSDGKFNPGSFFWIAGHCLNRRFS